MAPSVEKEPRLVEEVAQLLSCSVLSSVIGLRQQQAYEVKILQFRGLLSISILGPSRVRICIVDPPDVRLTATGIDVRSDCRVKYLDKDQGIDVWITNRGLP